MKKVRYRDSLMLKSGSCRQFIPIRIKVYSSEGRGARGSRGGGR